MHNTVGRAGPSRRSIVGRRGAVAAAAVALVATSLTGCVARSGTSGEPVGATGRFTIVGRDIVDPDGNRFYPVGANVSVRQGPYEHGYTFNWNGTATGHAEDAKALIMIGRSLLGLDDNVLKPLVVIAGAGAGKTETMAGRVVWLVANGLVRRDEVLGLVRQDHAVAPA